MADKTKRRLWTDDELDFIKENYLVMTYRQLADELGRTEQAVTIRIAKMGLRKIGNCGRKEMLIAKIEDNPDEAADRQVTHLDHIRPPYEYSDEIVDPRNKAYVILDFSRNPQLYDKLLQSAAADFRTPELQMLYYCYEALNGRSTK